MIVRFLFIRNLQSWYRLSIYFQNVYLLSAQRLNNYKIEVKILRTVSNCLTNVITVINNSQINYIYFVDIVQNLFI